MSRVKQRRLKFSWSQTGTSILLDNTGSHDLSQYVQNPYGVTLTYSALDALPTGVTLTGSNLVSSLAATTTKAVRFRVTDGTDNAEIASTVNVETNSAPAWAGNTPGNLPGPYYQGTTYQLSLAQWASDPDGDALTFGRNGGTAAAAATVSTAGVLTIPASLTIGTWSVIATVSDGINPAVPLTFSFTVQQAQAATVWPTQGTAGYLPIVRNGRGPGMDTPGGSGRNGTGTPVIYLVNSTAQADNGLTQANGNPRIYRGTLRAAINHHNTRTNPAAGPSMILFETSGTCTTTALLRNSTGSAGSLRPYMTIAGQTAPSPGFQVRGVGFLFESGDVLMQHLTVRLAQVLDGEDGVRLGRYFDSTVVNRVVLDHLTLGYACDETIDLAYQWNNVTIRQCILHDPLTDGGGANSAAGMLIDEAAAQQPNILIVGNLFHTMHARQPYSRARNTLVANNYIYNWLAPAPFADTSAYGVIFQSNTNAINGGVQNNVMRRGPSSGASATFYPVRLFSPLAAGAQLFVGGNYTPSLTPADSDATQFSGMVSGGSPTRAASPPYVPTGFVAANAVDVINLVTTWAGARPKERADTTTQRVISEARSNYTTNPQAVGTLGGSNHTVATATMPTLAVNTRDLLAEIRALNTTYGDVHAVSGTGYTYLENMLHNYEDAVLP